MLRLPCRPDHRAPRPELLPAGEEGRRAALEGGRHVPSGSSLLKIDYTSDLYLVLTRCVSSEPGGGGCFLQRSAPGAPPPSAAPFPTRQSPSASLVRLLGGSDPPCYAYNRKFQQHPSASCSASSRGAFRSACTRRTGGSSWAIQLLARPGKAIKYVVIISLYGSPAAARRVGSIHAILMQWPTLIRQEAREQGGR